MADLVLLTEVAKEAGVTRFVVTYHLKRGNFPPPVKASGHRQFFTREQADRMVAALKEMRMDGRLRNP